MRWGWLWYKAVSGPLTNKTCQDEDGCTTCGEVHIWACLHIGTHKHKHEDIYEHAPMQTYTYKYTHIQQGHTPRQMCTHANSHVCALRHPKPFLGFIPRPKDTVMCLHKCIHTRTHTCLPMLRIVVWSYLIAEPIFCPFGWKIGDTMTD